MFYKMVTNFTFASIQDQSLFTFGMDQKDYMVIGAAVVLIFTIGLLQENGIHIRETIAKRNIVVRFALYYVLIMFIIIFGAYGIGYIPLDPIYADF